MNHFVPLSMHVDLDELQKLLYSAVISDILDSAGFRQQTLDVGISALAPDMVVVGRAKTVVVEPIEGIPAQPFAKMLASVDSIRPGEIYIASTQGAKRSALFGGLLATATQAAGGRGAIIDGLARDAREIIHLRLPTFVRGLTPADSLGRDDVSDFDVSIECGGVRVSPGDLIFGDIDGIVVIPRSIEDDVITQALDKVRGENEVRTALATGMKPSEAFARYGIL